MVCEPVEALVEGPIETYLDDARLRLLSRHDAESVEELLAEFNAHLVESAAEFVRLGLKPEDAERRAIELFGGMQMAPLAESIACRTCIGDRAWGRFAIAWSVLSVVGLSAASLWADGLKDMPIDVLRAVFFGSLLIYGFACLKAKAYAMFRMTAALSLVVLMICCMIDSRPRGGISGDFRTGKRFLLASNAVLVPDPDAGVRVASDLGTPKALIDAIRRSAVEEQREAAARQQILDGAYSEDVVAAGSEPFNQLLLGVYSDRPMASFTNLQEYVPAPARIGGLWLLFAFLIHGIALWLTQLNGNPRLSGGVVLT